MEKALQSTFVKDSQDEIIYYIYGGPVGKCKCCDTVFFYDERGTLKNKLPNQLTHPLDKLFVIVANLMENSREKRSKFENMQDCYHSYGYVFNITFLFINCGMTLF